MSEEEKAIQFYKRFIEAEEQELKWMYREDEEYYKDAIEQKELLIKGWKNILNFITKLQKENKQKNEEIELWMNEMESWDEREQVDNLKSLLYGDRITNYGKRKLVTYYEEKIKKLIKEKNEKDKIINSMTDYIINLIEYNNPEEKRDKEEIKQHFETQIKKKEMRNNRICFL